MPGRRLGQNFPTTLILLSLLLSFLHHFSLPLAYLIFSYIWALLFLFLIIYFTSHVYHLTCIQNFTFLFNAFLLLFVSTFKCIVFLPLSLSFTTDFLHYKPALTTLPTLSSTLFVATESYLVLYIFFSCAFPTSKYIILTIISSFSP